MDKDRLAAFADGELSPEEAAGVVIHLADCPEDQAYVDDVIAASAALRAAFAAPLAEPVPAAIHATIFGPPAAQVLPFRPRPRLWAAGAALAASLALAAVVVPQLGREGPGAVAQGPVVPGPLPDSSELADVLASLPSGQVLALERARDVMILGSMPIEGGYCREVEVVDRSAATLDVALACIRGDAWNVEVVLREGLENVQTDDGFAAAAGAEVQGLTGFLDRMAAGSALSPEAEAAAISAGWRP